MLLTVHRCWTSRGISSVSTKPSPMSGILGSDQIKLLPLGQSVELIRKR